MRESESTAGQYSLSVRHEGKKYHYRIQVFYLSCFYLYCFCPSLCFSFSVQLMFVLNFLVLNLIFDLYFVIPSRHHSFIYVFFFL